MKVMPVLLAASMSLGGCADLFLEQNIRAIEGTDRQLDDYEDMQRLACPFGRETVQQRAQCSISRAVELAYDQADAYARAARSSQIAQDSAFAVLLGTAGWTALGAANQVSNAALTERVVSAVAVQQAGQRGVPRSAIQDLYVGASRMNCIALAGSLYEEVNLSNLSQREAGSQAQAFRSELGSFIMVLAMREVEYRTLYHRSRELDDFSALAEAFREAASSVVVTTAPDGQGGTMPSGLARPGERRQSSREGEGAGQERYVQQNLALERFFGVISGCLESGTVQPDVPDARTLN